MRPAATPQTRMRSTEASSPAEDSWLRGALREVADACSGLLPWGGRDDETTTVRHRGPLQIAIQTTLVTALAALGASLKIALYGGSTPGAWMLVLILLTVPLTLGMAAKPPQRRRGLVIGLVCGVVTAGAVLATSAPLLNGFWWLFAASATGFAVANLLFAALTQRAGARGDQSGGSPIDH